MTPLIDPRAIKMLLALRLVPHGLRLTNLAAVATIPLSSAQVVIRQMVLDGAVTREDAYRPLYVLSDHTPGVAVDELARWRLSTDDLATVEGFATEVRMRVPIDGPRTASIVLPSRVRASRRQLLDLLRRRARPGSGSDLAHLRIGGTAPHAWWMTVEKALSTVPYAVIGAVAAIQFMAARGTDDLDVAVALADLGQAEAALKAHGCHPTTTLSLYGGLKGKAWVDGDGHELDLIGLPEPWGREAIGTAIAGTASRPRTVSLPYAVFTKMISSRAKDIADIGRMLGWRKERELAPVITVVTRYMTPQDVEDLWQIIELGRLEFAAGEQD